MKPIHEMSIEEIEQQTANAIIRFRSKMVEAEDDNGNIVQCYLYHNKLLDYDCNELIGFKIKKNWKWLFVSMVFASIALITVIATQ
jgi:hypothetical protein